MPEFLIRRKTFLLCGAASAAMMISGAAFAQDAEEDAVEDELVVQGFRSSIENSTRVKRDETSIVEAVSAEDIGRLPDNSIAEALARLPGLTAQRLFGRAQVISVRGLAPDFTTALLNGREQVSAGDNRGVEFDQYPSELLSSVVVYKTPDAGLIGQGLAGTADLRTVRPLDRNGRTFAASARREWNDVGALNAGTEDTGYRYSLTYIDQSADGQWGWAFGLATNSSPTQAERWEAWSYIDTTANTFLTDTSGASIPPGLFVVGGIKPYVQSSLLERTGVLGTLEFEPHDRFHASLDMLYSDFEEGQTLRGIEMPLGWGGNLQPGFTVEDGLPVAGTFANVDGVVRNDFRGRESQLTSVGANLRWSVGENWSVEVDGNWSEVNRHDTDLELWAGTGPGAAGARGALDFVLTDDNIFLFSNNTIDYADPSQIFLTDPNGWGSAGFIKEPQTDDELKAIRLTAKRELNGDFFSAFEAGVNFSQREKSKDSIEHFVDLAGGNNQAIPVPGQFLLEPTALEFLGIPGSISFDPVALLNGTDIYELRALRNSDVLQKAWTVEEDVVTYHVQLDIGAQLAQRPLTGNVGVQFVQSEQSSDGFVATNSGAEGVTRGTEYDHFLPSLNLSWEFRDSQFLRFAAARTLARARMDDLRASFAIGYNTANINSTDPRNSYWSGNGGNPELEPWVANGYDVSYEAYFDNGAGYLSLAAFYKDLENFIFTEFVEFDFTGYPTLNPGDTPAINTGFANAPQNAEGGYIQGIEAALSIPFGMIFEPLDGLGFLINGSQTESNIEIPGNPDSALPGLSETVVNTTLWFDKAGFEARVSNRYRSDFLGEVTGFGAGRELRTVNGESVIDAQIGYRFPEGSRLEGFSVLLQGNNLTDEPFSTYFNGDERQVRDFQSYGATYLFGVSYRN